MNPVPINLIYPSPLNIWKQNHDRAWNLGQRLEMVQWKGELGQEPSGWCSFLVTRTISLHQRIYCDQCCVLKFNDDFLVWFDYLQIKIPPILNRFPRYASLETHLKMGSQVEYSVSDTTKSDTTSTDRYIQNVCTRNYILDVCMMCLCKHTLSALCLHFLSMNFRISEWCCTFRMMSYRVRVAITF